MSPEEDALRRVLELLDRQGQFNAIDIRSASKIDLIVRKDRPFSVEEFGRRQRVDLSFAVGVAVVSPEDAVLPKLEWAKSTDSERQLRDVASILEMNPRLDRRYVDGWAEALGVDHLWRRVASSS